MSSFGLREFGISMVDSVSHSMPHALRGTRHVQQEGLRFLSAPLFGLRAAGCANDLLEPSDFRGPIRIVDELRAIRGGLVDRRARLQSGHLFESIDTPRLLQRVGDRRRGAQDHADDGKPKSHELFLPCGSPGV
jgi:hypothetical protein